MSFELTPYSLPLVSPLTTSYGSIAERRGALVSLREGELVGWGDASPMPGWSAHTLDEVRGHLLASGDRLGSESVDHVLDALGFVPEARAALAGAALDLSAQQHGVPLAAYLDDAAAERVRVNASLGAAPAERLAAEARLAVAAGFTALKLKVGAGTPADDIERVAAVRRAVGGDIEVRLDANGAWDVPTALRTLEQVVDEGISFCEEPVSGIDALAAVGAESPIPIAVDESARTVDDIVAALGTGAIDVVVVKPQALGGPDLAVRAIRLAHQVGATVVVTSMIDSAVGVAHAVHVAAVAGGQVAHGVATSTLFADDVAGSLPVQDGHVLVPTLPGLGVSPR